MIQVLLAGRIDAIVGKESTIGFVSREYNLTRKNLGELNEGEGAFLAISKAAVIPNKLELVSKINIALEEMEKDGTIARISAKYIN